MDFILDLKDTVPNSQLLPPVRGIVKKLTHALAPDAAPDVDLHFVAQVTSSKGVQSYKSSSLLLLRKLLPTTQELDPQMAKDLIEQWPALGADSSPILHMERVYSNKPADPQTVAALMQRQVEARMLTKVQQLAPSDPDKALQLANTMSDPAFQAQALEAIAANVSSSDPALFSKLTEDANKNLDKITNVSRRLAVYIAAMRSAARSKDRATVEGLFRTGLKVGVESWQKELDNYPERLAVASGPFDALSDFVAAGAALAPQFAVREVRLLDPPLSAYLLVSAALGLQRVHRMRVLVQRL